MRLRLDYRIVDGDEWRRVNAPHEAAMKHGVLAVTVDGRRYVVSPFEAVAMEITTKAPQETYAWVGDPAEASE